MDARHRSAPAAEEDRGPLSLLRRLASVGLGRREDEMEAAPAPQPQRQQPRAEARPAAPAQNEYQKRPPQPRAPQNEGLYRPRQGDLDLHGRQPARETRGADDELEIPAFLRRQSN